MHAQSSPPNPPSTARVTAARPTTATRRRWRVPVIIGIAGTLVAASAAFALTAAQAATIDAGTWYQIISRHSGKALDIEGASTADGARLIQYTPGSGTNQQFRFESAGSGWWRIIARHSGKAIDLWEWNTADGAEYRQWPVTSGYNQQFEVLDSDGGYVRFRNRHSGKVLDLWEWSTANGARISQYSDTNGWNQQWQLVPVGSSGGGGGSTVAVRGVDLSSLKKNEDFGAVYYDTSGTRRDAMAILRDAGANWVRLKVWVNPADGYNTKARVLTMASRAKALGMKLLIDFHYSDSWADPGKQVKPAAWQSYSFSQLRDAVYDHTYDVTRALANQGTPADMVQIGNEINPGMLLPDGSTNNWNNLAQLLTAGANAAKAANSSTRIMLHLAEGGNNSLFRWWFDQATSHGVPFDVIGASYYPYWHGSLSGLQANLNDMANRYHKDVVVAETAYGFTLAQDDGEPNIFNSSLASAGGFPVSPQGQADELRAVFNAVKAVPDGHGLGVFYWEPAWTARAGAGWDPTNPNSGDGWENQAMFDFNDRALAPVLGVLGSA